MVTSLQMTLTDLFVLDFNELLGVVNNVLIYALFFSAVAILHSVDVIQNNEASYSGEYNMILC